MAKAKENKVEVGKGPKTSIMSVIILLLLLTLIAGGGGFAVATMLSPAPALVPQGDATDAVAGSTVEPAKASTGGDTVENGGIVRQLAPIITNLAQPKETWMRIEVSIVIDAEAKAEQDLIAVKSSDEILALLRTVDLAQIEGPSGFLHFREDINDLVRENSGHKVLQVLINSMVVE